MSAVRALEEHDLEPVAALFESVWRSGRHTAEPSVVAWFRRNLLEHPWVDPEVPSLVSEDRQGRVVGVLGSYVRRLCVDGEPMRLACSGHLVVAPDAQKLGVGALLAKRYLQGPQDVTITDAASETMQTLWERLGGETASLQCLVWMRPLRPWRHPLTFVQELRQRSSSTGKVSGGLEPRRAATDHEPLTPATLVEAVQAMSGRLRLRPDYDEQFASWLLEELARCRMGDLRTAVLRRPDGRPLGYYAYFLRVGGLAAAVAVAGATEEASEVVLRALLDDARANGAGAVFGRVEPRLLAPVKRQRCLLLHRPAALVHAADPRLLQLSTSGRGLLTRMEGEWWLRPELL